MLYIWQNWGIARVSLRHRYGIAKIQVSFFQNRAHALQLITITFVKWLRDKQTSLAETLIAARQILRTVWPGPPHVTRNSFQTSCWRRRAPHSAWHRVLLCYKEVLLRNLFAGTLRRRQATHWQKSSPLRAKSAIFSALRFFSSERMSGQASKTLWFLVAFSFKAGNQMHSLTQNLVLKFNK